MDTRNDESPDIRELLNLEFERHRPYLRGVAYRMLGSVTEADDALQGTWLRLDRRPPAEPADLRPWLTTVVGRICLDMLRSRRARREDYAGSWLPEPVVVIDASPGSSPEEDVAMADSVGLALLVVLETLSPSERLAFVLHDVFAVSFEEIGWLVDRTPTAARQLASRARRRIRAPNPEPDADVAVQRRMVDAFLAASRAGDFDSLVAMLDPDVVLRFDGGGKGPWARSPIHGRSAVLEIFRGGSAQFAPLGRPALVNGALGIVVGGPGRVVAVVSLTVVKGLIRKIDMIGDQAKLRRLRIG